MLEQETDLILQSLTARTVGSRQRITLREALSCDLPRGIKTYLTADVVRSIEEDFQNASALARIDRSSPGIERLARHFLRTLAQSYTFSREDFIGALDNAVHFLENYLCRPQWTLVSFLFQEKTVSSSHEIVSRLEYFADYAYFPSFIERVIRHQARESIALEDFKTFLARIDDHVVRQHNPRELALLTRPIFDFLLLRAAMDHDPVPVKALLVFFEDKKMKVLKEYIETIARIRSINELSIDDLTSIIENLYHGQGSDAVPTAGPAVPETREEQTDGAPGEESIPLSGQLPLEPPPHVTPLLDNAHKNIPLSLTFSGLTEYPVKSGVAQDLPEIRALIPDDLRAQFVRRIFMNDFDYFDSVIAALNSFQTWDEASAYLDELYELNGLNPSRPEVKEFADAIRHRYSSELQGGE